MTTLAIVTLTTIFLSIFYIYLMKSYPRCMFYTAIILTMATLLALTIFLFAVKQILAGIVSLIFVLIFGCVFFCCLRGQLEVTIIIIKLSSAFLL